MIKEDNTGLKVGVGVSIESQKKGVGLQGLGLGNQAEWGEVKNIEKPIYDDVKLLNIYR